MKITTLLGPIVALAFFTACSPSPQSTIIGTWTGLDGGTSEFLQDGTVIFKTPFGGGVTGKWEIPSAEKLKYSVDRGGVEISETCELELVDKDTIKVTRPNGVTDVLKRIKD